MKEKCGTFPVSTISQCLFRMKFNLWADHLPGQSHCLWALWFISFANASSGWSREKQFLESLNHCVLREKCRRRLVQSGTFQFTTASQQGRISHIGKLGTCLGRQLYWGGTPIKRKIKLEINSSLLLHSHLISWQYRLIWYQNDGNFISFLPVQLLTFYK